MLVELSKAGDMEARLGVLGWQVSSRRLWGRQAPGRARVLWALGLWDTL